MRAVARALGVLAGGGAGRYDAGMACLDLRSVNLSVVLLLAGCTANPLFHVESDSGPSDGTAAGTTTGEATTSPTSGSQTGEAPTSEGGSETTGSVGGETSSGGVETTGEPTSDPSTSTGPDPGTTLATSG